MSELEELKLLKELKNSCVKLSNTCDEWADKYLKLQNEFNKEIEKVKLKEYINTFKTASMLLKYKADDAKCCNRSKDYIDAILFSSKFLYNLYKGELEMRNKYYGLDLELEEYEDL